jgi:hypothetical protein
MSLDRLSHYAQRYSDQLPTEEARQDYAERVSKALQEAARAMLSLAEELKLNPDHLLGHAFQPVMVPAVTPNQDAGFHVEVFSSGEISIKSFARRPSDNLFDTVVGFRAMCKCNIIESRGDDLIGT